ncbi:MAG: OmpA family protein, partial [Bacteroidales bacterium]|nr:OmpA family protein [Bacteroidales bacterium]
FYTNQILPKKTYNLVFSKEPLYFNAKGQITTVGLEQSKDLVLDKNLRPIPKKPIVLPDILYDLAKWDLKPQYQDSLNDLFETMMDNPKIVIELASHTDTRAKDEYNDTLSQKRAQSVVNYLIQKGIDTERMIAKGYGEKVPRELKEVKTVVFNNKKYTFKKGTVITDAFISKLKSNDEKEAAHQLNRRTEFRIIRQDYIPKPKSEGNIQTPVTPVIKEEAKPIDATKDIKPAEPIKDDKTGKKDATKQQKQAPEKKGSVGKKK